MLLSATVCHADFKYTQQSQVTGGSLVSMTKTLGVFSKNARKITEPQLSTTMVKGGRMRQEHSDGTVQIIDLEGKRFINIDTAKKTYTTMTFDEFKAAMQRAQEQAKEQQAKAQADAQAKNPQAANVKIVPKMSSEETGATKSILNLPTKEVKWRLDMEMQSTDPSAQAQAQGPQSVTTTFNSDSWIAESVPGYDEMHQFFVKMAKELDWLPGTMSGMTGMNMQSGQAMDEFRKNSIKLKGMPLLQTTSMSLGASGMPPAQGSQQPAAQPASNQQTSDSSSIPTSTHDAISKGLGSMMGGFGKKKKTQDQQAAADQSSGQPAAASNSLMDTQTQVMSYSSDPLDKSLFDIPAGYTQVQANPDDPLGMKH
jgi:hypothetical protein